MIERSEFSERPFALGTMTGIRSFRVDQYGRLLATQIDAVWLPGENTAQCWRDYWHPIQRLATQMSQAASTISTGLAVGGFVGGYPTSTTATPKPGNTHRAGVQHCSCGFYAYFIDGSNSYHGSGNVRGIIDGFGIVTVGSRGFRCEKATIVGLVIGHDKEDDEILKRVRANYPDVEVFGRKRDAIAAHPLTPPPALTPEADPEFWTRGVL